MGTQEAIAEAIIEGGADYVLALKGNQGALHQAVIESIDDQLEGDLADAQEHVTTEKGHGREEARTYLQLTAPEELPGFLRWRGLKSIGLTTSCCLRDGQETIAVPYYISSLGVDVKQFARAVRGHWGIENGCHWVLDMTFREDESRIRERHLRENFAWLNRFALSRKRSAEPSLAPRVASIPEPHVSSPGGQSCSDSDRRQVARRGANGGAARSSASTMEALPSLSSAADSASAR